MTSTSSSSTICSDEPAEFNFAGYVLGEDRYELLHQIGKGSFGRVFLAVDLTSPEYCPTHYAVKIVELYPEGDPERDVQIREATIQHYLSSSSRIAQVRQIYADQYYLYVVMDHYRGGDMFHHCWDKRYVDDDYYTRKVLLQIVNALLHCHDHGVFHRDLKPENILCWKNGTSTFLSDFGLATTEPTGDLHGVGTRQYMSPENYNGEGNFCHRANDVFALGIIIFNIVSGQSPWGEPCRSSDQNFIAYEKYGTAWLRAKLPKVTDKCFEAISRALDVDPTTRITLPELKKIIVSTDSYYREAPIAPIEITRPAPAETPLELAPVIEKTPLAHVAKDAAVAGLTKAFEDFRLAVPELKGRLALLHGNDGIPVP